MIISCSKQQRALSIAALAIALNETKNCMSTCRRLEVAEAPAESLLGSLQFVDAALGKTSGGGQVDGPIDVTLTPMAGHAWRIALGTWIRQMSKRDKADRAKGMSTNLPELTSAAQGVLNQLNDQLSLPVADISAFIEKPAAEGEEDAGGRTFQAGERPLPLEETPSDPRGRRGPKPAEPAKAAPAKDGEKPWDEGQPAATKSIADKVRRERGLGKAK